MPKGKASTLGMRLDPSNSALVCIRRLQKHSNNKI